MNPMARCQHGMRLMRRWAACALLGLGTAATQAQAVYRCQAHTGTVVYSERPCSPAPERLTTADTRTARQVQQSHAMRERNAKLAKRMQGDRLKAAKQARQAPAVLMHAGGKPAHTTPPRDKAGAKPARPFTALVPQTAKADQAVRAP